MKIDVYFDTAAVLDVQQEIIVQAEQKFTLLFDEAEGVDIFSNNDDVLDVTLGGASVSVDAVNVGVSTIRFMRGDETVRRIVVSVVDEVKLPASALNAAFGEASPK